MKTIQRLTALLLSVCLVLAALPTAAFAADGTATVTVNVTYNQTEARSMLELVNDFRTGDDAWAWDEDDTEQVYYTGLSELAYDYALEEAAMQRAAEIALSYSHTRPNGMSYFTAYSWSSAGENIAAGTALNTAAKAFALWQEADEDYSGQGHRRNMLSSSVTAVAVACVYYNGCYYWVQEFRTPTSSQAATTANDSATDVDVEIALSDATVTVTPSSSAMTLTVGETASLPTLTTTLKMTNTWPSKSGPVTAEATWTVDDESCATLSDGAVSAVAAGSTTLTATVLGETVTVDVTVEEAACEHVTEIQNAKSATCTEDGYTGDEVCTVCGETVTAGETIPATGHSYESVVTEPTCTEGGYTTYTCSACGDSYTGDGTDATGHSYTYTSNGDGTHTVSCAQGDLTAYSESCTYEDGVCAYCGAEEPESSTDLASGTCGDNLTWVLDEDGVLTISGSGDMTDWSSYSSVPWYDYQNSITSVTIENGVTSIGSWAFSGCFSLTDVYYAGSEDDWAAIDIGTNDLSSATIHYNSDGPEEHTHTYSTPTWTWSGTSSAKATFTCTEGDDTQAVTATITSETTAATYTAAGKTVYTATVTFDGTTYTTTKTVTIARLTLATPSVTLSNASTGVKVSWGAVDGADKYRVYRKLPSDTGWTKLNDTTSTSYTDTTAESGTTYYYSVRAYCGSYSSSYVTNKTIVRLAQPSVSLSNASGGVKVSWGAVTGTTSYRVYRKASGETSWTTVKSSTTSTSYTDTTAKSGTTYYYSVRAYSGSYSSSYVTNKTIVRLAQPSVSLSNASGGVKVSWGAVDGATSYRVYRKASGETSWTTVKSSTTSTSYTDTTAKSGTTYYYSVRAYCGSYSSSYVTNKSITCSISSTVDVTDTGTKYHVSGCRYLSESANAMSLSDAKAAGYTACSVCNPPA